MFFSLLAAMNPIIELISNYKPDIYLNDTVSLRCSSNHISASSLHVYQHGEALFSGCTYDVAENDFTTSNELAAKGFSSITNSTCVASNSTRPFTVELSVRVNEFLENLTFGCVSYHVGSDFSDKHVSFINLKSKYCTCETSQE